MRPALSFPAGIPLPRVPYRSGATAVAGTNGNRGCPQRNAFITHGLDVVGLVVFARAFVVGALDCTVLRGFYCARHHGPWRALVRRPGGCVPIRAHDSGGVRLQCAMAGTSED